MKTYPKAVGAVLVLRGDGAALMQLRDEKPGLVCAGMWALPGGEREAGETLEACAKRELHEETGYRCGRLKPLFKSGAAWNKRWNHQLSIFGTRYDGKQKVRCFEGQALRFIKRSEVFLHPMPGFLVDVWDCALKKERLTHAD